MTTSFTRRRQRQRDFAVRVGVYFAILAGVMAQWAVTRFDAKELTMDLRLDGFSVGRVVVALIVATLIYRQIDGRGDLTGKAQHADRALTLGFTAGFTLMGVVGIGE